MVPVLYETDHRWLEMMLDELFQLQGAVTLRLPLVTKEFGDCVWESQKRKQ